MKTFLHDLAIVFLTIGVAILLCGYSGLFRHLLLATNIDTPDDILHQQAISLIFRGWHFLFGGMLLLFISRPLPLRADRYW